MLAGRTSPIPKVVGLASSIPLLKSTTISGTSVVVGFVHYKRDLKEDKTPDIRAIQ